MSRNASPKMDARTAWTTWMTNGSSEAAAEFLDRIGSWTDGTAAQLTRGGIRNQQARMTREEVVARLHHHLGVFAEGEPVTYIEALERARRQVIEEFWPRRAQ